MRRNQMNKVLRENIEKSRCAKLPLSCTFIVVNLLFRDVKKLFKIYNFSIKRGKDFKLFPLVTIAYDLGEKKKNVH